MEVANMLGSSEMEQEKNLLSFQQTIEGEIQQVLRVVRGNPSLRNSAVLSGIIIITLSIRSYQGSGSSD